MVAFEFPGEYYEIIRADFRNMADEAEFLAGLLEPGGRVLDVGCGTGVLLRALAARGHPCVGVDPSVSFTTYAKEAGGAAGAQVDYVNAPIGDFETPEQFDLVMCVFATLNMLPPREVPAFFTAARRWLRPGGKLIIEAAHLLNFVESYQPAMVTQHGTGRLAVTRLVRTVLTPHEALWRSEESILVRCQAGPPEIYDNFYDQWVYTAPELRRELSRAGFELIAEFGSYQGALPAGRGPLIQVATPAA